MSDSRTRLPSLERMAQYVRKRYRKVLRSLRPMPREYRRRFRMNLGRWLVYHQRNVVKNGECYWMGVPALKNPCDAWIYQEIICEVKPDVIIEIGSYAGGTTLYFAHLLDLLGKGMVISIDIDRSRYDVKHDRIVTITGDSSSPETIGQVAELCRNRSVLVVHDGDHTRKQVIKDLRVYAGFVSVNSYLIVEDGVIDLFKPANGIGTLEDGPLLATEEFLRENSDFAVDSTRERYLLTYNPKGFLKRVR